jgi:hypothetical protein
MDLLATSQANPNLSYIGSVLILLAVIILLLR